MRRAPRAMLAIAMAIALAATASGCGLSFFFPVVEESTPIPEEVDAALEPYYTQVLSWDQCGEFLCATARAPSDCEVFARTGAAIPFPRQPCLGARRKNSPSPSTVVEAASAARPSFRGRANCCFSCASTRAPVRANRVTWCS